MTKTILLWGATGFTGRLVAQELLTASQPDERLIFGGRSDERLRQLASELGADARAELRCADALDEASMSRLLDDVGVVATTVGPYRRYGWLLAKLCAERGIDYVDLCGETPFIRRSVDELSEAAQRSGARLVHACGFDSIPSDLGTLLLAHHCAAADRPLEQAMTTVRRLRGGLSGGTLASMFGLIEDAVNDKSVRRVLGHPYSLNPADQRHGADGSDRSDARYDEDHERWTAPFIMAGINTRVVRRSAALLGYAAPGFRYDEAMACKSKRQAKTMALGTKLLTVGAALAPTRWLMRRYLPSPGQGPSPEQRASGCFELHIVGRTQGLTDEYGRVIVGAQGDPGYSQTAVMLAQSARLLAEGSISADGGVHTPASALGMAAIERLRSQGFRFEFQRRT